MFDSLWVEETCPFCLPHLTGNSEHRHCAERKAKVKGRLLKDGA